MTLPVKNLPVAVFTRQEQESAELPRLIRERLQGLDAENAVLALPGCGGYAQLARLAEKLVDAMGKKSVFVSLEADAAKALGQKITLLRPDAPCLCIDSVPLRSESYLDIGQPIGPALPVAVKTLVMGS